MLKLRARASTCACTTPWLRCAEGRSSAAATTGPHLPEPTQPWLRSRSLDALSTAARPGAQNLYQALEAAFPLQRELASCEPAHAEPQIRGAANPARCPVSAVGLSLSGQGQIDGGCAWSAGHVLLHTPLWPVTRASCGGLADSAGARELRQRTRCPLFAVRGVIHRRRSSVRCRRRRAASLGCPPSTQTSSLTRKPPHGEALAPSVGTRRAILSSRSTPGRIRRLESGSGRTAASSCCSTSAHPSNPGISWTCERSVQRDACCCLKRK
jgi:hypothetical protein